VECIDGTQAHHWDIEPSQGSTSTGTCNKCNQVKKFTNSIMGIMNWRTRGEQGYSNKVAGKDEKDG